MKYVSDLQGCRTDFWGVKLRLRETFHLKVGVLLCLFLSVFFSQGSTRAERGSRRSRVERTKGKMTKERNSCFFELLVVTVHLKQSKLEAELE